MQGSCVVTTALAEVGVQERGKNSGARVKEYLASCGLGKGHPWCAAFVKWCFKECNYETAGANAFSPTWFPKDKVVYTRTNGGFIETGDVFGIYYPSLKRIAHVGIVESVDDNEAVTIEGNTNGDTDERDGQGVHRKRRKITMFSKVSRWN